MSLLQFFLLASIASMASSFTTIPPITKHFVRRSSSLSASTQLTMKSSPQVPYKFPGTDQYQFIDIYSRLYRDRILLVGQYIDAEVANQIVAILLYLRNEDSNKPITFYFQFPGADLRPALAIYDTIQECKSSGIEITTLNMVRQGEERSNE